MHPLLKRRAVLAASAAATAVATLALPLAGRAQPRRIVSVGGALTETLFALGAEREIVGVDTTSLHPAAARALPSVGYARALSAEGVLSLSPTLLVATADAGPPAVLQQLKSARLPLEVVDSDHRFEGLIASTQRLAQLTGREAEGAQLITRLNGEWAAATTRTRQLAGGRPAPRVLFVLSHSMAQVRVAGRDTGADAMIRLAGGANAFSDVAGYKPLTPEGAIAAAPELILATEQGLAAAGGIDGLLKAPGLAATPAGRARRVVALDALLLLGFGPRLPQAVAQLAGLLHG
jgi:iron complex transport system substrate-binding protein